MCSNLCCIGNQINLKQNTLGGGSCPLHGKEERLHIDDGIFPFFRLHTYLPASYLSSALCTQMVYDCVHYATIESVIEIAIASVQCEYGFNL